MSFILEVYLIFSKIYIHKIYKMAVQVGSVNGEALQRNLQIQLLVSRNIHYPSIADAIQYLLVRE